jgi:hypothetical protein
MTLMVRNGLMDMDVTCGLWSVGTWQSRPTKQPRSSEQAIIMLDETVPLQCMHIE